MNHFDLAGRVAVVVGRTGGVARDIAAGLAGGGADVVVLDRDASAAGDAVKDVERRGRRGLHVPADVSDLASLAKAREACLEAFGRLDILVTTAITPPAVPTLSLDESAWRQAIDTNVTGMLRACQVFGEPMVSRKYGRVVAIGALPSMAGLAEVAAFASSNAAVAGLTRALAIEWGAHGVTVNAILPGVFSTGDNAAALESPRAQEFLMRAPMKRFGRIGELVGATLFLASDASAFVTGHVLSVDGGYAASGVNK